MRTRVLDITGLALYWVLFRGSYFMAFFSTDRAPAYMAMLFDCILLLASVALLATKGKLPGWINQRLAMPFGLLTTAALLGVCLLSGPLYTVALWCALPLECLWVCAVSSYWGLHCLGQATENGIRSALICITVSFVASYVIDLPRFLVDSSVNHLLYALYPLLTACIIKTLPPLKPVQSMSRPVSGEPWWALPLAVALFLLISTLLVGTHIGATSVGIHRTVRHGISIAIAAFIALCCLVRSPRPQLPMASWWATLVLALTGTLLLMSPDSSLALFGADALTAGRRTIWLLCWILLLDITSTQTAAPIVWFGGIYPALFSLTRLPINTLRAINPSQYMPENELYIATLVVSLALTALALFITGHAAPPQVSFEPNDTPPPQFLPSNESLRHSACHTLSLRFNLSDREKVTLEQLSLGYTVKKISELQYVSENTIKTHTKSIYRKMGCHSKQELIDRVTQLMGEQDGQQDAAGVNPVR